MRIKNIILILTLIILALLITPVYAEETPEFDGEDFYAKGTPIVITQRTDGQPGALITWNGGTQAVSSNARIFGGGKENSSYTSSNITMTGGTVSAIFGGGLKDSAYVENISIVINQETNIFISYLTLGGLEGNANKSALTVNSGTIELLQTVCRGKTEEASVLINNGTIENLYIGGELDESIIGVIGKATVEIVGGKIQNLQAGSSGGVEITKTSNVQTTVKYLSDAVEKSSGAILDNAIILYNINSKTAELGTVTAEKNIAQEGETVKLNVQPIQGYYPTSIVVTDKNGNKITVEEDYTIRMPASNVTVEVTYDKILNRIIIEDEEYIIEYGRSLSTIPAVQELMEQEKFLGLYIVETGEEVDLNEPIESFLTLEAKFEGQEVTIKIGEYAFKIQSGKTLADLDLTQIKTKAGATFIKFVKAGTDEEFKEDTEITSDLELEAIFETHNNEEQSTNGISGILMMIFIIIFVAGIVFIIIRKNNLNNMY